MNKVFSRLFLIKFQGFFEDYTGRPDQKRSKYHGSDIAVFSFLVFSCLIFNNSVILMLNLSRNSFLKKNEELLMTVNQYSTICRYIGNISFFLLFLRLPCVKTHRSLLFHSLKNVVFWPIFLINMDLSWSWRSCFEKSNVFDVIKC